MKLLSVTWSGSEADDPEILEGLPAALRSILEQLNGFIQLAGGLHVRGASSQPEWHSLREAWQGERSFVRAYPVLSSHDIPFAQDCVGDQFLIRSEGDSAVAKLHTETGVVEDLGLDLRAFMQHAQSDPLEALGLHPLLQLRQSTGKTLEPGELISVWPPLCSEEAAGGVAVKAVPVRDRLDFLADFSARVTETGRGGKLQIEIKREN